MSFRLREYIFRDLFRSQNSSAIRPLNSCQSNGGNKDILSGKFSFTVVRCLYIGGNISLKYTPSAKIKCQKKSTKGGALEKTNPPTLSSSFEVIG